MKSFLMILTIVACTAADAQASDRYRCNSPEGGKQVLAEDVPGLSCTKLPRFPDMTRWELVSIADSGALVFLDTQTIVSDPGSVTVWVQYFYDDKGKSIGYTPVVRTVAREEYNCKAMTTSTLSSVAYDFNGNSITGSNTPYAGTSPIVPDTVTEAMWRRLCK